jgi:hypothetical protein
MTNLVSIIVALHLSTLSKIESGDNDHAIGKQGEVSRYQITPENWRAAEKRAGRKLDPTEEMTARIVAFDEWSGRLEIFCKVHAMRPTPAQLYLIWHRPARVLHPRKKERERADRFENLFLDLSKRQPGGFR